MRLVHPDLPGQPIDVPESTAQTLMEQSGWTTDTGKKAGPHAGHPAAQVKEK